MLSALFLLLQVISMFIINTLFFFIRTSKFYLRLAVLIFFQFLRLKSSYFVLISPTEVCNGTKKNVRLSTIKTRYFIFLVLSLSSSAHRQPLGVVPQKIGSATVLKPIKKYLQRSSIFIKVARFKPATILKLNSFTSIFRRF